MIQLHMTREASCSCDQLKVVCTGEPIRVSICHCFACQRRSGSAFSFQARFPVANVKISGLSKTYVRLTDDDDSVTFHSCPTCASTVYYQMMSDPEVIAVAVGMFNDSNFPSPHYSVYEGRKHSWIQLTGDMDHID